MLNTIMKRLSAAALGLGLLAGTASVAPAQDKSLTIAYVEWSDAVVATNIVKTVLEDKGYTVRIVPLSGAAMWQAVATGEADATVAAWLPVTHQAYFDKLKERVVNLGPNVSGARIGWAVPAYMTEVNSVEDLKTAEVGGKIIGIDPGAGLMRASENAIKDYDLDLKLVEGSDATMVAALKDAYARKAPIVVTTWTPHWMFATWELKYLTDPKGTFGGEETVNTVVRLGLDKDLPEAYAILDAFALSLEDEQKVMVWNNEAGADPAATARKWVDENKDKVAGWTK